MCSVQCTEYSAECAVYSLLMSGGAYRPGDWELAAADESQAPRLGGLSEPGEMGLVSPASDPASVLMNTGLMDALASILTSSASATWKHVIRART